MATGFWATPIVLTVAGSFFGVVGGALVATIIMLRTRRWAQKQATEALNLQRESGNAALDEQRQRFSQLAAEIRTEQRRQLAFDAGLAAIQQISEMMQVVPLRCVQDTRLSRLSSAAHLELERIREYADPGDDPAIDDIWHNYVNFVAEPTFVSRDEASLNELRTKLAEKSSATTTSIMAWLRKTPPEDAWKIPGRQVS